MVFFQFFTPKNVASCYEGSFVMLNVFYIKMEDKEDKYYVNFTLKAFLQHTRVRVLTKLVNKRGLVS